ncbi:hypothetical protein P3X46_006875 [Hevea brasiliensis]|uniref:25S rRNA (uridine-N(3))-methyltransferase BMT5-like domain-containing protein n=1 Tax=Hevea brasiliensis TaxID=3981 RepID=A0ABQ9MU80_HEVBR|nr:hypothetical protein P3X46_006875 [Hevea brasiliensis]
MLRNIVVGPEEKWIKHYSSSHQILLVGEGDFSFGACLARAFGSATNIVATSLDSRGELMMKYSRAAMHLEELQHLGCTIIHGVDACTMGQHSLLQNEFFDRIVFNFPHAPLRWLKGFLRSARDMLARNGEAHVTHKTAHPFGDWEIVKIAEQVGLHLVQEVSFYLWEYPGYQNKKGSGRLCDNSFPVGQCCTYKFAS